MATDKLTDTKALRKAVRDDPEIDGLTRARIMLHIANARSVDAVEVVRCKKCLFYNETIGKDSGKPCGYGSCCVPGHITGIVYDEDFCSYGERISHG